MFKRCLIPLFLALWGPVSLSGGENEDEKAPVEDEVSMEYDSEESDCHEKVLRLTGMVCTEKGWTIWLNNISISSESTPQAIKIGNHSVQVLSLDREKKTVRLMVDAKEIQLALRQEYSL